MPNPSPFEGMTRRVAPQSKDRPEFHHVRFDRRFLFLAAILGLGGCTAPLMGPGHMGTAVMTVGTPVPPPPPPSGRGIALLAPLTGVNADLGPALVDAARLGLGTGTVPPLTVIDTGSTPQGAATAAQQAIAGGAGLILGPLTDSEADAIAPITEPAHVDVLAFTSDPRVARPGLWTLGVTPTQQVTALAEAARADSHGQIAGLLPLTPLGQAMQQALTATAPAARIQLYTGFGGMNGAVRVLSDYANRRAPIDARIKELESRHTAAALAEAARLARQPVPPPPFNALLVAETGTGLGELASLLPYYDVDSSSGLILGPGLWAADPAAVAAAGFGGALYAAPDPAAAADFVSRYQLAFGSLPPPLAAVAFDAGGIARLATEAGGIDASALTNPAGFAGADGVVALQPDGSVRRGLAVYRMQPDGAQIIRSAPWALPAPGI
jgi:branched-chain amino acid transport system substrate-binding protein